jgi:hypothetical protein
MPYVELRRKEINGLLDKRVFELTNVTDIPKDVRIFRSHFVDKIKNTGTDQAYEKSRCDRKKIGMQLDEMKSPDSAVVWEASPKWHCTCGRTSESS